MVLVDHGDHLDQFAGAPRLLVRQYLPSAKRLGENESSVS
jgi:hypothetical protein